MKGSRKRAAEAERERAPQIVDAVGSNRTVDRKDVIRHIAEYQATGEDSAYYALLEALGHRFVRCQEKQEAKKEHKADTDKFNPGKSVGEIASMFSEELDAIRKDDSTFQGTSMQIEVLREILMLDNSLH